MSGFVDFQSVAVHFTLELRTWEKEKRKNQTGIGGPCRDRTCGPLIKSQLLYQLS